MVFSHAKILECFWVFPLCVCVHAYLFKSVSAEVLNLSLSLSLCLSLLILPLWETKLFLKKSLCLFERGEEGEAGQQNAMERILAACAGLGWGPFAPLPRPQFSLPSKILSFIMSLFKNKYGFSRYILNLVVGNDFTGNVLFYCPRLCCQTLDIIFMSTDIKIINILRCVTPQLEVT